MSLTVLPIMRAVDFMAEAKEVINIASSLASTDNLTSDDPISQLVATIQKELPIVLNYIKDLPVDCIINSALRTRTEYVLYILHHCQRKFDKTLIQSLAGICLTQLFDLLKVLEQRVEFETNSHPNNATDDESCLPSPYPPTNQDNHFINECTANLTDEELQEQERHRYFAEQAMGKGRTQWVNMCFTATAMAMVALLRQFPGGHTQLLPGLQLTDYITLTHSQHWQVQCVGLRLVWCMLVGERDWVGSSAVDSSGGSGGNNGSTSTIDTSGVVSGASKSKSSKMSKSMSAAGIEASSAKFSGSSMKSSTNTSSNGVSKSVKERSNSSTGTSNSGTTRVSTSAGSGMNSAVDGSLPARSISPSTHTNNTSTTNTTRTARSSTIHTTSHTTSNITSSTISSTTGVPPLRRSASSMHSSVQQGSFRALSQSKGKPQCVEDLCRKGLLCTLFTLLLHTREIVRKTAAEVLQVILDITFPITTTTNNDTNTTTTNINNTTYLSLVTCCVEQGLIPHLEYIHQGVYVYRNPELRDIVYGSSGGGSNAGDSSVNGSASGSSGSASNSGSNNKSTTVYFPETQLRLLATTLLDHVVRTIDTHPALLAHLTAGMMHSTNIRAKANILTGLLYISGRSAAVGRQLCEPLPPSNTASTTNSSGITNNSTANSSSVGSSSKSVKGIAVTPPISSVSAKNNISNKPLNTATTTNSTSNTTNTNNTDSTANIHPSTLSHTTPRHTLFYHLLTTLLNNTMDFSHILRILIHFMQQSLRIQDLVNSSTNSGGGIGNEISTQTEPRIHTTTTHTTTHSLLHHMEPMVLIQDSSTNRTTRMVCPPLRTIQKHSDVLTAQLQDAMERQIQTAMHAVQTNSIMNPKQVEAQLLAALKEMDDAYFVVLKGSYSVWQEIFSHMSDPYLRSSVHNMSTNSVIECLYLTTLYNMRELGLHYARALTLRVDAKTDVASFVQIFQASVGIYFPTKPAAPTRSLSSTSMSNNSTSSSNSDIDPAPLTLHLFQALHCLKHLEAHLEGIVDRRKVGSAATGRVVVDCVHRILLCILLSE